MSAMVISQDADCIFAIEATLPAAQALLGQGGLSATAMGQQNQLYMQGQAQRQATEQAALDRQLQEFLQAQRLKFNADRIMYGTSFMG